MLGIMRLKLAVSFFSGEFLRNRDLCLPVDPTLSFGKIDNSKATVRNLPSG